MPMHLELITLFMFTVADIELIRTLTTRMFKLVGFLLFTKLSTQLKFVTVNICECLNAANLYHSIVSKRYTAVLSMCEQTFSILHLTLFDILWISSR